MSDQNRRPPVAPVLLGVCARMADKSGSDVRVVRALWVLSLLLFGPAAPVLYVFTHFLTREE